MIACPAFARGQVKLQVPVRLRSGQALPYATPDFLSSLVALANFVRLSEKAAYVALGGTAM